MRYVLKLKNIAEKDVEICRRLLLQFRDVVHIINDKLTVIQGATENVWSETDKKDFYCTQQLETIIRSVDTISARIDSLENVISNSESNKLFEIPAKSGIKKKILLAEDDVDTCNIIKIFLEKANIEVVTAENGKKAVKYLDNEKFDMIITDINMPEISGTELYRIIRKKDNDIPVLFISGFEKITIKKLARNDNNAYYLTKPFKQIDVIRILEKIFL